MAVEEENKAGRPQAADRVRDRTQAADRVRDRTQAADRVRDRTLAGDRVRDRTGDGVRELAGVAVDGEFARDFADRWQKAWNSCDPARVVALCTEDVVWEDPITDQPERGREAVTGYLRSVWTAFPDLRFTWPEGPCASFEGTKLALHWRVTGTMLGRMEPPGFAPTGKSFEIDGVDLLELRDGLVCAYCGFFDVRGVAQRIGALPAPGSRAERLAVKAQNLAARLRGPAKQ